MVLAFTITISSHTPTWNYILLLQVTTSLSFYVKIPCYWQFGRPVCRKPGPRLCKPHIKWKVKEELHGEIEWREDCALPFNIQKVSVGLS